MATNTKKWYHSKTLWLNAIAIIGIIAQMEYGFVLEAATEGVILGAINIAVRAFTKQGIE